MTKITDQFEQGDTDNPCDEQEQGARLTFSGKSAAKRLSRKVQPRTSRRLAKFSMGPEEDQALNQVIEGENLQAMVTLYRERGQVDLILTDPPYNTGKDFRYNDRWNEDPNDPHLGQLVAADDPGRHTKWMRFMLPPLKVMYEMLKPSGVLAICIDHRELFPLGAMLDELFNEKNRLAIINWQKATALKNDNSHVSTSTEYVLVYAKNEERASTASLERTVTQNSRYSNPDNDPRGLWREGPLVASTWVAKDDYAIQSPFTGEFHYPQGKTAWRHPKRHIKAWLAEWGSGYIERNLNDDHTPALVLKNGFSAETRCAAQQVLEAGPWPFIWFGRDGDGVPRKKISLTEVKAGKIPETFWATDDLTTEDLLPEELGSTSWTYQESARSSDGAAELTAILGEDHQFETVKPLKLFAKLVTIWCPPNGLVMDPFAGSGTTGHAVLQLNADTGSERRFIMIEQGRPEKGDPYARSLLADRLKRVITGNWANGKGEAIGGGYRFLQLQNTVDAKALLMMERNEMTDTVIATYYDAYRRGGPSLVIMTNKNYSYLVARNALNEGFYLVWGGSSVPPVFTEQVYDVVVAEAIKAGLKPFYHVYARFNLFQSNDVRFYQIPDQILMDFGLDLNDAFNNEAGDW
ncbi:MAG: site-specific DNA-methyltransferase [Ktedonobacteraceae bacterium]|nr:site-specific DNA-methyltransferase [Ktedonobacteraceae bacterium]